MKNTHVANLTKDMNHWKDRKNNLLKWIETHHYDHPDFIQNLNDLRNAECKVQQIESRIKRQGAKSTFQNLANITCPIISTHYSL